MINNDNDRRGPKPGGRRAAVRDLQRTGTIDVRHGDCLDALRTLPDASIDAIVTDPPYELTGKSGTGGFMGKRWDGTGIAYSVELWRECLRVLKPGGHLAAFGGTRTYHRMACAVEDAGFEIRDSLSWLYGSGFPKSLDVGKAIDKAGGDPLSFRRFAQAYAATVAASPHTHTDVDRHLGIKSSSCYWAREDHRGGLPPRHHWEQVRDLLGLDAELERLYDEAEREVIGERTTGRGTGKGAVAYIGDSDNRDVTAPATDAARTWQGWGTALKPSIEPVVVAVKPLGTAGMLAEIGSHLDRLEFECSSLAKPAVPSFGPTHPPSGRGKAGSAPASAATQPVADQAPLTATGAVDASSAPTATSASASEGETCLNTVTSWQAWWAELCALTSTSATAITSSTTTDLKTLSSCLSRLTPESITQGPNATSGLSATASAVGSLFAACVLSSRATLALSAGGIATGGTPISPRDATGPGSPAVEPIVLARKPLSGTVAQTVLAHGTGALNIDGTRVAGDVPPTTRGRGQFGVLNDDGWVPSQDMQRIEPHASGRWPANVLLSHSPQCGDVCQPGCPVAELDAQSGTTPASARRTPKKHAGGVVGNGHTHGRMALAEANEGGYADQGGASRFFAQFRYQAKAPKSERPKVDGVGHPTVKPLALMQWLVRLITPPGGVVLDPFAGSGTTGQAASLEGFDAILIEREADYLPLIAHRLGIEVADLVVGKALEIAEPIPVTAADIEHGKALAELQGREYVPWPAEVAPVVLVDPVLVAIGEALTRDVLVAVWRAHKDSWTDEYQLAVKTALASIEAVA